MRTDHSCDFFDAYCKDDLVHSDTVPQWAVKVHILADITCSFTFSTTQVLYIVVKMSRYVPWHDHPNVHETSLCSDAVA